MFIYSVMLVPRLWVNPKSGLLNHQVMVNLVQETTVSLISQVDYLTCHRSDLSQMLRICDRWSCGLWMFLYRNVPCVSRLFLTLGVSSGIAMELRSSGLCHSLFWVSSHTDPGGSRRATAGPARPNNVPSRHQWTISAPGGLFSSCLMHA
jgi:hypothetical protein